MFCLGLEEKPLWCGFSWGYLGTTGFFFPFANSFFFFRYPFLTHSHLRDGVWGISFFFAWFFEGPWRSESSEEGVSMFFFGVFLFEGILRKLSCGVLFF